MVVFHCKRLPDEGDCIQLPQDLNPEHNPNLNAELCRFMPEINSIEYSRDYHGWDYLEVRYKSEEGAQKHIHVMAGSFIIKRSNKDWSVYPEQTFKKMYTLEGVVNGGPLDGVITW